MRLKSCAQVGQMMASVTIKVEGLKELGQALTELSNEVARKVVFQAALAGANVVKKQAKESAHVAEKAYRVQWKKGDKPMTVQPGNIAKNIVSKRTKELGVTAEYSVAVRGKKQYGFAGRAARLIEFGTVKQSPKPFLQPSFEQNIDNVLEKFKDKLSKSIEKANRKK